nr:hypothetical protein [Sphingomonas sp. H160509]
MKALLSGNRSKCGTIEEAGNANAALARADLPDHDREDDLVIFLQVRSLSAIAAVLAF